MGEMTGAWNCRRCIRIKERSYRFPLLFLHAEVPHLILSFHLPLLLASTFVFTPQVCDLFLTDVISSSLKHDLRFYSNLLPNQHLFSSNFQFNPAMTEMLHDNIFANPTEEAQGQNKMYASYCFSVYVFLKSV